jgi:hypothetical protein
VGFPPTAVIENSSRELYEALWNREVRGYNGTFIVDEKKPEAPPLDEAIYGKFGL